MRIFLIALVTVPGLFAQSFYGTLRGRVLDPNGQAATAAVVTLTDPKTSAARETVSNEAGEYNFTSVQPSRYTVAVEVPGFKRFERQGVDIATQAVATLDLTLAIGEVSEHISVTEDAPLLEAGDASIGQVIDSQKITDLPMLGRNSFFTAKLAQNVVFVANPKMGRMQDQNANSQLSIDGGPVRTNNFLVDGISITDSNNRAVFVPSPEAVQEVKLQGGTYDAEVSRTGGGTLNSLLRSGGNTFHVRIGVVTGDFQTYGV